MTTTTTDTTLTITRHLKHPPERVWRAWTDHDEHMQWGAPTGMKLTLFEADFRVGGTFRLTMIGPPGEHSASGTYKEIVPNRRMVYTWKWSTEGSPDTLITLTFEPKDGGTRLTLVHELLKDATDVDNHRQGWTGVFDELEKFLR